MPFLSMIGRRYGRTDDVVPAPAPAPPAPGPPPGTQLLTNTDFLLGTLGWTAQGGFATYSASSASRPAITSKPTNPSGFPSNGYLIFSFPITQATENVYQNITLTGLGGINSIKTEVNVLSLRNKIGEGVGELDSFKLTVEFKNSTGTLLQTLTTGSVSPPGITMDPVVSTLVFTNYAVTLDRSTSAAFFDTIKTIRVILYGYDRGGWNGNFGPVVDSCYLTVT